MMALGVALHDPNAASAVVRDGFIIGALMMIMMVLPCAGIAWLIGRSRRPPLLDGAAKFYFYAEESSRGPFPLNHIKDLICSRGWSLDEVQVCAVDTTDWRSAKEVLARMKPKPEGKSFLSRWREQGAAIFQPSDSMNYRIFIPSIILALFFGALLHWGFAERYRFQSIGSGKMIKTDRWTGNAWSLGYDNQWRPVK